MKLVYALLTGLLISSAQAAPRLGEETILPGEAERHQAYGRMFSEIQTQIAAGGVVRRGLHAKSHGCVEGRLTVTSEHPELLKGLFVPGASYGVLGRFSNGSSEVQNDRERDFRGLALRVFNVSGARLETSSLDTFQDLLLTNAPAHFAANSTEMMEFVKATAAGRLATLKYLALHPSKAARILHGSGKRVASVLSETYWSRAPFRHGEIAVKYVLEPCVPLKKNRGSTPDYLREDLKQHLLNEGSACFDLLVQPQTDPVATPIEDATVEWKSPAYRVARLMIPMQDIGDSTCDDVKFNPWNGLAAHRPLGEMNRARKAVYPMSQSTRGAQ